MKDNVFDIHCKYCLSGYYGQETIVGEGASLEGLYGKSGGVSELFKKRIWRVDDVARFLECTKGHIYNLVSDEKIPKRKKGGLLFFIPEEILDWVYEGD